MFFDLHHYINTEVPPIFCRFRSSNDFELISERSNLMLFSSLMMGFEVVRRSFKNRIRQNIKGT